MKFRIKDDKLRDSTALEVVPSKGAQLNYASSRSVMDSSDPYLLHLTYDESGDVPVFDFDVTDRMSLADFLSVAVSGSQFLGLLDGAIAIARLCDKTALDLANVVFMPQYVYLDKMAAPAFAFVPLTKPETGQGNINGYLSYCASAARFTDPADSRLAHSLSDWLRRRAVFSLTEFTSFLDGLKGIKAPTGDGDTADLLEFSAPIPPAQTAFDFVADASAEEASGESKSTSFALVRVRDRHPWPLSSGQVVLGRGAACDIAVSDSTDISREHARLRIDDTGCSICDTDSANGVKVDGQALTSGEYTAIPRGTSFFLADEEFIIE